MLSKLTPYMSTFEVDDLTSNVHRFDIFLRGENGDWYLHGASGLERCCRGLTEELEAEYVARYGSEQMTKAGEGSCPGGGPPNVNAALTGIEET